MTVIVCFLSRVSIFADLKVFNTNMIIFLSSYLPIFLFSYFFWGGERLAHVSWVIFGALGEDREFTALTWLWGSL